MEIKKVSGRKERNANGVKSYLSPLKRVSKVSFALCLFCPRPREVLFLNARFKFKLQRIFARTSTVFKVVRSFSQRDPYLGIRALT